MRPLRVRLTLAFATVIALLLVAAGVLVYDQFRRNLDGLNDAELVERQATVVSLARDEPDGARLLTLAGEPLAQVYAADGRVAATTRPLRGVTLLRPAAAARARRMAAVDTVDLGAVGDDGARIRAFPVARGRVVVIADDRGPRERSLQRLAVILALVLPGALALSSLAGYQVARAALAPVEAMRNRAALIGDQTLSERLPEPGTDDELDRLARTLNDLLERLAAALERERRIVGDASHELRTPISVLRTRVDVALRAEQTVPALQAALAQTGADARRLGRLADDLLVLARADQGQLTLRLEPLDVQDVLEHTAARHAATAADQLHRIEVHNEIDGGAVVLADPDRLAQALDNLVVNAIRYGEGAIELSARLTRDGLVAFTVRDHGSGFPIEFVPRAFERFSQADEARGGPGSGLGLALVRALIEAHGGTAGTVNHPQGGAIASVTIPLA